MEQNKIIYHATIYICNLKEEVDESEINCLCQPLGELESIKLIRDKDSKSLGFAYVNFTHRLSGLSTYCNYF